jgi:hypothetical protein
VLDFHHVLQNINIALLQRLLERRDCVIAVRARDYWSAETLLSLLLLARRDCFIAVCARDC